MTECGRKVYRGENSDDHAGIFYFKRRYEV
jgi:hypothetical protein